MKKYLLIPAIIILSTLTIQAQSRWGMGIQHGGVTNISRFSSGDEGANALFSNNFTRSLHFAANVRYKISEKFTFQTGISFTEFGFSYGMAKDYSLKKPFERNEDISATTCISTIPVMVLMNTPVNCNNIRFVFGAGVTLRATDSNWDQTDTKEIAPNESGNTGITYLTAESRTTASISPAITWQIGLEKVLRRGNSISFMYTGNQGLTTIAESEVEYTADNKNYSHTFINRGSFVSFSLAYNFMPFGTRKALKVPVPAI